MEVGRTLWKWALLGIVACELVSTRADIVPLLLTDSQVEEDPYKYTGLIMTVFGEGSGAVVHHPKIVLSCAHVVFDQFGFLDPWLGDARWFQKYHANTIPSPSFGQRLRGYVRFEGYQFSAENFGSGDLGTLEWDFVAHFAYENVAAGEFAGGWIDGMSALRASGPKMITGYPIGLYPNTHPEQSKMHVTGPFSAGLRVGRGAFLLTDGVTTGPGNSGGPIWVQTSSGTWSFAGVLLAGSAKSLGGPINSLGVRAMDADAWALVADAIRAAPPANDNFTNRLAFPTGLSRVTGSNAGATTEANEPPHADVPGGRSVWWTWTAPATGTVSFDVAESSFDAVLAVYTGSAFSNLRLVANSNNDASGKASFRAVEGTTYHIAVDGYYASNGKIVLKLTSPPRNDHFFDRLIIPASTQFVTGSNVSASQEAGEPIHAGEFGGKSVWWSWTAPASGTVIVDTIGSAFDTLLAVYTGNSVPNLTFIAADDNSGGIGASRLTFPAIVGTTYHIVVDGWAGDCGDITLNVRQGLQISSQPVSRTVALGGSALFLVSVTGTTSPTYQWRKEGVALSGATNSSYILTNAQPVQAGAYDVVIKDAVATVISSNALLSISSPYTFGTLAGVTATGSADGPGSEARFNIPAAVAVDSAGNIYLADSANHTIRKVTPAGIVSTVAGLAGSSGTANGSGTTARFNNPRGIAVDLAGNLYVADQNNQVIRKITAAGTVSTFAGTAGLSGNADGSATSARFAFPAGVAVDAATNVYVADQNNHTIRKITAAGAVSTFAGLAGNIGSADAFGTTARFSYPSALALDVSGNLYVADSGNDTIRKITPAGFVTTLAGSAGNSGRVDGIGSSALFNNPTGVAVDAAGNVFVADQFNHAVRRITPSGLVSTFAGLMGTSGSADGSSSSARFSNPGAVGVDSQGNVYVTETGNNALRKIAAGAVSTLAGKASVGSMDGVGASALFQGLDGLAVSSDGTLYVSDNSNHTIRKITPSGSVSTLAGSPDLPGSADGFGSQARFNHPETVALDSAGNIYVPDTDNHTIRKITPAGLVSTLAGFAGSYGTNDGVGSAARLLHPAGVAVDKIGNVFVADQFNHTIRKISSGGLVSTFAGLAGASGSTDGIGSTARFSGPESVTLDGSGNLYVADYGNGTIRKITPDGLVSTVAGKAGSFGFADGVGSSARFTNPTGVAVDASGNVYVADAFNNAIRLITPNGIVSTLAGSAFGLSGSTDAVGTAARFFHPFGIAVDAGGTVYVSDSGNNVIRKGVAFAISVQPRPQSVPLASPVTFSVTALSLLPLSYQWLKDGVLIVGATNQNYVIASAQTSSAGNYSVVIGNGGGSLTSSNALLSVTPVNDQFATPLAIPTSGNVTGSNIGGTKETGEPNHAGKTGGRSVWWTWTAATNGPVTVDTIGSSFDTLLAVYTGASVTNLNLIASDDDSAGNGVSRLSFFGSAGVLYRVAVDGNNAANGAVVLNI